MMSHKNQDGLDQNTQTIKRYKKQRPGQQIDGGSNQAKVMITEAMLKKLSGHT
jgi:hypothetical protein